MKKIFYMSEDIAAMLSVSKTTAYRIIHKLNEELKSEGYITVAGRVPKHFLIRDSIPKKKQNQAY